MGFLRRLFSKFFGKSPREELRELWSEVYEIEDRLDRESLRFRRELDEIDFSINAKTDEMIASYNDEVDKIIEDNRDSEVVMEAELIMVLSNMNSRLLSHRDEALLRLDLAKARHDDIITPLHERKDECLARIRELMLIVYS